MRIEIQRKWAAGNTCERPDLRIQALLTTLIACLVLPLAGSGCLGWTGDDEVDPAMQDATLRAAQIETLREDIEQDHRTLEDLITQPGQAADASLHEDPALRAIATRLSRQERLLETLLAMDADDLAAARDDSK